MFIFGATTFVCEITFILPYALKEHSMTVFRCQIYCKSPPTFDMHVFVLHKHICIYLYIDKRSA